MTSVLGAVCCSTRFHYQELIRNRGFMRDRKQHTGILLLNVPWQRGNTWERFQKWNPQDLFFPKVTNFLLACFLLSFHIPTTNSSSNFQQNIKMLSIPSTSLDKLKAWFFFFFLKDMPLRISYSCLEVILSTSLPQLRRIIVELSFLIILGIYFSLSWAELTMSWIRCLSIS